MGQLRRRGFRSKQRMGQYLANTRALLAQDDAARKHPAAFAVSQFTKDSTTQTSICPRGLS